MADLTKRERIKAALAGKPVDRVPTGFWRHWPGDDQHAFTLAEVTLDFQQRFDLDFIKFPVSSTFCVDDYGVRHAYTGKLSGDREHIERPVKSIEDWDKIEPLDVRKGTFGLNLEALRMVIDRKHADTPLILTVFNPLAMACYLAGDDLCLTHLRSEPERVQRALKALTSTCVSLVKAAIEEGCDGIFLSARAASYEMMGEEEYNCFGRPWDLEVLESASAGWFNVLHLHGQHPLFVPLSDYPVQAINWHDRSAGPSLAEAAKLCSKALMAGVEQQKTLLYGTFEEVELQVHDAISQTGGRRLIVTPGCTYSLGVPHSNLLAIRRAVE
jgi:uroporphyrinogen decarboxylase